MTYSDYLQREAEGVAMRKEPEYMVNWDFDFSQHEIDDILIADELRRMGERRRATDAADGFNAIEDGEDEP